MNAGLKDERLTRLDTRSLHLLTADQNSRRLHALLHIVDYETRHQEECVKMADVCGVSHSIASRKSALAVVKWHTNVSENSPGEVKVAIETMWHDLLKRENANFDSHCERFVCIFHLDNQHQGGYEELLSWLKLQIHEKFHSIQRNRYV